jgi:hypothetical protein
MHFLRPTSTGQGNLVPVSVRYILDHLEPLRTNRVRVFQGLRNATGELRAEPVDPASALNVPAHSLDKKLYLVDKDWQKKLFEAQDTFDAQLGPLLEKSPDERAEAVRELKNRLVDLKNQSAGPETKAHAIMETVSQTFLLNKASLKSRPLEVGPAERSVAGDTQSIVAHALEMSEDPALAAGLFAGFQGLSNGQTVNHVLRVFTSYTGFLRYYLVQHQGRLVSALRRIFGRAYGTTYRSLLPNLPNHLLTSDQVLQLPTFEPHEIREFSLGAFLHDIGKLGNLDYFESDAVYDPNQIRQHVFLGAGLILMNYGTDHEGARLLAGDHHNALGHPGGYGVTRMEREKGLRPPVETVRVLSASAEGFISGQALGWLPTEMLAVADVYDAMTDDSRTYKKPMTPAGAAAFLEETMAGQGKLDPVLVDLYIDFLRSRGLDIPEDRGFAAKVRSA